MSQLVIHIGLPKTATTSLQKHVFEKSLPQDWHYLGVLQPRSREMDASFRQIMNALNCNSTEAEPQIRRAKEILERLLATHQNVLISEEMISVDTDSARWQDKITRLANLVSGLEPRILVTVREPAKASFSLYVQQWNRNQSVYRDFDDYLDNSNQAQIFHYQNFIGMLESLFGHSSIRLVAFEKIKQERAFLDALEQNLDIQFSIDSLPRENSKTRNVRGTVSNGSSVAEWLLAKSRNPQQRGRRLFLMAYQGLRPVRAILKKVPMPGTRVVIPQPDLKTLSARFNQSNLWLRDRYSIDYLATVD